MQLAYHLLLASSIVVGTDGSVSSGGGFFDPSNGINGVFGVVANTLIFLTAAIAVIMVIVGGLRYVLSGGNPKAVEDAKNTILYSIVGIVVASAAYAIVYFVSGKLH
jgi:hypothetical protein